MSCEYKVGICSYNTLIMKAPYQGTDDYTRIAKGGTVYGEDIESRYGRRIAQKIVDLHQDCIALQEVNQKTFDKLFEKLSPYGYSGVYSNRNNGEDEGLAIFYLTHTFLRVSHQSHYFNDGTGRGILNVGLRLKTAPSIKLHVLTTHIDYRSQYQQREFQALADIASRIPGPKVVCGDFNVTPNDMKLRVLWDKHLKDVLHGQDAPTFSYGRIDYVLFSPEIAGIIDSKVVGSHRNLNSHLEPSDHLPITTTIALKVDSLFSSSSVKQLSFRSQIPYGNQLFIRGNGNGLSWDKGQPLEQISPGQWTFSSTLPFEEFDYKLLLNDCHWEKGGNRHYAEEALPQQYSSIYFDAQLFKKTTQIHVRFQPRPSDQLFIRGTAPGMSWERGVLMRPIQGGHWLFETQAEFAHCEYKILLNDKVWEKDFNHSIACGKQADITPQF